MKCASFLIRRPAPWWNRARASTLSSSGHFCWATPPSWCRTPATVACCSRFPGMVTPSSAQPTRPSNKLRTILCRWNRRSTSSSKRRSAISAARHAREDILSVYVGIRPLVKAAGGLRQDRGTLARPYIHVDNSGLLTIAGGKWTTYRHMAEDCVDHAITLGQAR